MGPVCKETAGKEDSSSVYRSLASDAPMSSSKNSGRRLRPEMRPSASKVVRRRRVSTPRNNVVGNIYFGRERWCKVSFLYTIFWVQSLQPCGFCLENETKSGSLLSAGVRSILPSYLSLSLTFLSCSQHTLTHASTHSELHTKTGGHPGPSPPPPPQSWRDERTACIDCVFKSLQSHRSAECLRKETSWLRRDSWCICA